jgi:hypothetical protein
MTYSIYRIHAFVFLMCIYVHTEVQRDISLTGDSERRVIYLTTLLFRCIQDGEATKFVKMLFLETFGWHWLRETVSVLRDQ